MRRLILVPLLLAAPAFPGEAEDPDEEVSVEKQVEEGDRLTAEAQALVNRAHDMTPSKERNAVLAEAAGLIRKASAAYVLAAEIHADAAKDLEAKITDLKGMLFWCNKSFCVLVPEAVPVRAPDPAPPEPGTAEDPAPEVLPIPRPPLSEADRRRVQALLDEALKLSMKAEAGQETLSRYLARVKAARAKVFKLQADFKPGSKPGQTRERLKGWDFARAELMREAQGYREKALSKSMEIAGWQAEEGWALERLEYYGEAAFPLVAELARRPNYPLTEGLVAYFNRQVAEPAFRFTPLPAGPAAADPALAQPTERLLSEMAEVCREIGKLREPMALQEERANWSAWSLRDLDKYWTWRAGWGDSPELKAAYEGEIREAERKAERKRKELEAKEGALRTRLGALRLSLSTLPADRAAAVEAWRLKQPFLPAELSAELEAWTRKALNPSAP